MSIEFIHKHLRAVYDDHNTNLEDVQEKGLYKTCSFIVYSGTEKIAYFKFSPMPDCCGIVFSHNTYVLPAYRSSYHSNTFRELKTELAKKLGYSAMIATTVMTEVPAVGNMFKSGYKIRDTFRNKRTSHDIGIGIKIL